MRSVGTFVIKEQRKFSYKIIIVICVCIAFIIAGWYFGNQNIKDYVSSFLGDIQQVPQPSIIMPADQGIEMSLREQVNMLQRNAQLDHETLTQAQQQLVDAQNKIYHLQQELKFYESIMDAAKRVDGLSIQGLRILASSQPLSYRCSLVLINVVEDDKVVEGTVDLSLQGVEGGKSKILNIRDVLLSDTIDLAFSFKSFRRFNWHLLLPESFTPHQVVVRLYGKNKKTVKAEKIFEWIEVTEDL